MENLKSLNQKTKELYRNTKEIILFFEDQIAANLTWYRIGNLMFLNKKETGTCVFYDEKNFVKI